MRENRARGEGNKLAQFCLIKMAARPLFSRYDLFTVPMFLEMSAKLRERNTFNSSIYWNDSGELEKRKYNHTT
jgi:hypothetical protein